MGCKQFVGMPTKLAIVANGSLGAAGLHPSLTWLPAPTLGSAWGLDRLAVTRRCSAPWPLAMRKRQAVEGDGDEELDKHLICAMIVFVACIIARCRKTISAGVARRRCSSNWKSIRPRCSTAPLAGRQGRQVCLGVKLRRHVQRGAGTVWPQASV